MTANDDQFASDAEFVWREIMGLVFRAADQLDFLDQVGYDVHKAQKVARALCDCFAFRVVRRRPAELDDPDRR
jgi:hypothetical protein